MKRKTSPEQDIEIIALFKADADIKDICQRYSISYPVLSRLLTRNNIPRRRRVRILTCEEKLEVVEFCLSGNKSHETAAHFGISPEQVFKILKREKLKLPRGRRSSDPNHVPITPGTKLTPEETAQRRRENHAKWAAMYPEKMKQFARKSRIKNIEAHRARTRKYYREKKYWKNPGKIISMKAWMKKYLEVPANRLRHLVDRIKIRCRRKQILFDPNLYSLTKEAPETCACCKERIDYSGPRGFKKNPSFDRVIPEQGYVLSNIRIICLRCNALKSNASLDELKMLVTYVEQATQKQI